MAENSIVYHENSVRVEDTKTGAVVRDSSRPADPIWISVYWYECGGIKFEFMARYENKDEFFVNPITGGRVKRRVPIRFVVDKNTLRRFQADFQKIHGTPPADEEARDFLALVKRGIYLLATYGGKSPELFPTGEVVFSE